MRILQDRIKKLRKALDLTQYEFGKRIGTTQNAIGNYEIGHRNPSSSVINNICKTFNVNETWLRTGEGDMFAETPDTLLDQLAREYNLTCLEQQIITQYLKLTESDRAAIQRYIQGLIDSAAIRDNARTVEPNSHRRPVQEMTREELHAELDRQLNLERGEETSPASSSDTSEKIS